MSTGVRLARRFKPRFSVGAIARLLAVAAVALAGQTAWGAASEGLTVISDPQDEWYAAGDEIRIRAAFDEAVRVEHNRDIKLRINIGGVQREATLSDDRPASRFTFVYRVQNSDEDTDGIQVDFPAFVGGSFVDQDDDTNVSIATTTLAMLPSHKVDGVAPSVVGAPSVASNPGADNTYAIGDVIEVEVDFDEEIRVGGNPELVLSIGSNVAMPPPAPPAGPLSRRATLDRVRQRHLVFRYEVQAGDGLDDDGIQILPGALIGGVIEDRRGNPVQRELPTTSYANHEVDAEDPSVEGVEITSTPASGNAYGTGEVIEVQVTFDEVVFISPTLRLALDIGAGQRYANYANGSGTTTIAFRYTVAAADQDDDGISIGPDALRDGTIEDDAGNDYNAAFRRIDPVREQPNHRVNGDVTNPTATEANIVSSGGNDGYSIGDVIEVAVSFNVVVFVGEPREPDEDTELRLILDIGGTQVPGQGPGFNSRYATFVEGSGTDTLRFRYVVQPGDRDVDGIAIGPGALVGASIVDADGRAAGRRFPVVLPDPGQTVDAQRPAADGPPQVESSSGGNGYYGLGERIIVSVTLTEPVHVTEVGDDMLALLLAIGDRTRRASFVAGSGTNQLEFHYTVRRDDSDSDGFTIGPDALVGGVIQDNAGNPWGQAERRLVPLPANGRNRVDGGRADDAAPFVRENGVEFAARRSLYGLGETIEIEITFSELVFTPRSLPVLEIAIGGNLRNATLADGGGTDTLTFEYIVQDTDEGRVSIAPGELSLLGGTIVDNTGNAALRDFEPLVATRRVDGVPPEAEMPCVVENAESRRCLSDRREYGLSESIFVRIAYDEPVYATDTLQLVISIGEHSRRAAYFDGSGSDALVFRYVVQRGDRDDNGISIGPDALVGGTIEDRAGNDWGEAQRRLPPLPQEGSPRVRVRAVGGIAVIEPDGVKITERDGNEVYGAGEHIEVTVKFNQDVFVTGTPSLTLQIGSTPRQASLVDGSGTDTLTFRYTVQAGDYDEDGISIGAGPGALVGGTIQDGSGADVDRSFEALPADGSPRVDAVRPAVQSVSITSTAENDADYGAGEDIEVEIRFSREVHVTGTPSLTLLIGSTPRQASYVDGSGTPTLTFRYTVQAGDYDDDGISIGAGPGALVGGTIRDGSGADVDRSFEALAAEGNPRVDAVRPTVENVEITSTAENDADYGAGEDIEVEIRFSREVHVTGTPSLTLLIGSTPRQASYVDGSGTSTLTFRYTVQAGDYDDDGISIGAGPGALVGGTIRDGSGSNIDRSFEAKLADDAHRVDAVRPTVENVEITSTAENDADYGAGEDIEVEIRFSREVHVTGTPSLTLLIGSTPRQASYVDGSGTPTLTFRYTVQAGDYDDDGISIGAGPGALVGGTIRDGSGSNIDRSFEAKLADDAHRVDAVNPTVQSVSISSTPAAASTYVEGERIEVVVQFDDDVRIVSDDNLALRLTIGEHTRDAAPTRSAGTTTRSITFRYTVRRGDVDTDGISIAGDALRGGLEDRVGDPVDGRLDPLPNQSGHLVGAEVALGVELNLVVNGPPGVFNLFEEILVPQGIRHYTGTYLPPVSENPSVATARVSGHRLVITPHAEGTSAIVVAAEGAAIRLLFAVTVQANQAEVAVLQHALAAMGRGILSSAAHTIGTRLETKKRDPLARYGQRVRVLRDPALGNTPQSVGVGHAQAFDTGWQTNTGDVFGADHSPWQGPGQRTPRQGTFEMPLIGGVSRDTAWALWGAGDFSAFEGEPESARFEGDLTAAYVGVDARGEGWLAGAAVGRVDGDADYQFTVDERTSKGNLETTLTVVNPYVQWSLGERGRMWAMVGVGNGEASLKREDRASPAKPTDIIMRMGMAGLRTEIATAGNFRFALRGDVGSVQLETDDGATALHGLAVNVQRARAGVETSFPLVSPDGGELTPFLDIGARYDAGDGQTGTGAEVAVGMRASSGALRFEAKARTLVMQGEEDYSETGASATVIVEPGSNGKGLRLSLSPRWGGADDSMDVFWQRDRGNGLQAFKREMERGWGVAGRVDYGVAVNGRRGDAATVRPFGEVDVVDDDNQRLRVGMAYELESDAERPLKFEISSERVERDVGTEQRYLLTAEGRF